MKDEIVQCVECGMNEREEWVRQDKHVCGLVTDSNYVVTKDMLLRIGKKRFVNIKVKK